MDPNKRPKMDIIERDRLSELPNAIIHQILSFLPTVYVIRMSLISKRWKNIWLDLPVLDLSCFGGIQKSKMLCAFASKCFKLRRVDMIKVTDSTITKVKLKTFHSWKNIDGWLKLVAKSNVRELDLQMYRRLNVDVLQVKSLTHLSIYGVSIEGYDSSVCLSSLVFLSLKNVHFNDQILNNLLLNSPSLETLIVKYCRGLNSFKISSSSVKFLDCSFNSSLTVHVQAANLEHFVCHSPGFVKFDSVVLLCGKLKTLSFSSMVMKSYWFEGLISGLPCLESFTLICCTVKSVKIRSHSLKHFVFSSINNNSEIVMDTPNLAQFSFTGDPNLEISMNVMNLQEAKIKFSIEKFDLTWYTNLVYFLSNLGGAKTLGIYVDSEQALIVSDRFRKVCKSPSLDTKHMRVRTRKPVARNKELKDFLFWIAPSLETLSMEHDQSALYRW